MNNKNIETLIESNDLFIYKIIENNIEKYKFSYSNYFIDLFNIYKIPFDIENKSSASDISSSDNNNVIVIENINETYEIMTLYNFMKYNQFDIFEIDNDIILKFIYDIGFIIKLLEREKKTIFSICIKDIIVVNNNTFLFINTEKIVNINKKYINYYNSLTNDELLKLPLSININELPISVYYNNVYYSFGILILDLLYYYHRKNYVTNTNCLIILKLFKKYKYTGLYYFIKRCLQENNENRALLFL